MKVVDFQPRERSEMGTFLREIAASLDAGEYGECRDAVIVLESAGSVYAINIDAERDPTRAIGLLTIAQRVLIEGPDED